MPESLLVNADFDWRQKKGVFEKGSSSERSIFLEILETLEPFVMSPLSVPDLTFPCLALQENDDA